MWAQKSNLDYLSLDFNSASPSPVQKVSIGGTTISGSQKFYPKYDTITFVSLLFMVMFFLKQCNGLVVGIWNVLKTISYI